MQHLFNNGVVSISGQNSVLQRALALNATSFVDLVYALDMAEEFAYGPFTLFLPTNEAFTNLKPREKQRLRDQCFLKKLLKHHLVRGSKRTEDLNDGDTLVTLANEKLTISQLGNVRIFDIFFIIDLVTLKRLFPYLLSCHQVS